MHIVVIALILSECARGPQRLLQQRQHALRNLVGLGHHGRAGLLQDLGARQVGSFRRKIRI